MALREKLPSFRLFISPHSSRTAVLVLCLNLGRTYTFHCRRKGKRVSKWLGFLCQSSVLVRSGFDSQSAGPEFESHTLRGEQAAIRRVSPLHLLVCLFKTCLR